MAKIFLILLIFILYSSGCATMGTPRGEVKKGDNIKSFLKGISQKRTYADVEDCFSTLIKLLNNNKKLYEEEKNLVSSALLHIIKSFLEMGEYYNANNACSYLLENYKENAEGFFQCAKALIALGEIKKAREYFEKYIEILKQRGVDNPPLLLKIASSFEDSFYFDEAMDYYQKYYTLKKDDENIIKKIAILYLKKQDPSSAEKMFQTFISLKERSIEEIKKIHSELAGIFVHYNAIKEAECHYQSLIKLEPLNFSPYKALIILFEEKGMKDDVRRVANIYLGLIGENFDAILKLLYLLEEVNEKRLASEIAERYKNMKGAPVEFFFLGGKLFLSLNSVKEGKKDFEKFISSSSDKISARRKVVDVYLRLKRNEEAEEELKKIIRYPDADSDDFIHLAKIYKESKKKKEEEKILFTFLKRPQKNYKDIFKIGKYLIDGGWKERGKPLLKKIIEDEGANNEIKLGALLYLADHCLKEKEWENAISYLRNYLILSNDSPSSLEEVKTRVDKNPSLNVLQIEVLNRMVKVNPSSPDLHFSLAEIYLKEKKVTTSIQFFKKYVELSSHKSDALMKVSDILLKNNRHNEFYSLLKNFKGIEKENPYILERLFEKFLFFGEIYKAKKVITDFILLISLEEYDLKKIIKNLIKRKMWNTALYAYEKYLKENECNTDDFFNLGLIHINLGNKKEIVEFFDKFIEKSKNKFKATQKVAKALKEGMFLKEAIKKYEFLFENSDGDNLKSLYKELFNLYLTQGSMSDLNTISNSFLNKFKPLKDAILIVGEKFYKKGFQKIALKYIEEYYRKHPEDIDIEILLLKVFSSLEMKQKAYEIGKKIFNNKIRKDDFNYLSAGEIFEERGWHDEAIYFWTKGIEENINDSELYLRRFISYYRKREWEKAYEDALNAIKFSKEPSNVLSTLRNFYLTFWDLKRYSQILEGALKFFPRATYLTFELGVIYLQMNEFSLSKKFFDKYLEESPSEAHRVGKILIENERFDDAIAYLKKLGGENLHEISFEDFFSIIEKLRSFGEEPLMNELIKKFLDYDPENLQTIRGVAEVYSSMFRDREAIFLLEKAYEKKKDVEDLYMISFLKLRNGMVGEAVKNFLEVIEKLSDKPESFFKEIEKIHNHFIFKGLLKEANLLINKALEIFPEDTDLLNLKITNLTAQYNFEDAMKFLVKLSENLPIEKFYMLEDKIDLFILKRKENILFENIDKIENPRIFNALNIYLNCITGKKETKDFIFNFLKTEKEEFNKNLFYAGEILYRCGAFEESKKYLLESLKRGVREFSIDAAIMIGKISLLEGNENLMDEVEGYLSSIFEDKIYLYKKLGEIYYALQLFERSKESYKKALNFEPYSLDHIFAILQVDLLQGDYIQMKEYEKKYLEKSASKIKALDSLSAFYKERLKYSDAILTLSKKQNLTKVEPNDKLLMGNYALFEIMVNEGKNYLEDYLNLFPDKIRALRDIIEICIISREFKLGEFFIQRLKKENENDYKAYYFQGLIFLERENFPDAFLSFDKAFSLHPRPEILMLEVAKQMYRMEKFKGIYVKDLMEKVISKYPQCSEVYLLRGLSFLDIGEKNKAIEDFQRVEKMGGNLPLFFKMIGKIAVKTMDLELGVKYFNKAIISDISENVALSMVNLILDIRSRYFDLLSGQVLSGLGKMGLEIVKNLRLLRPSETWYITLESEFEDMAGNENKSEGVFYDAMNVEPTDGGLFNNLSYLFARKGKKLREALSLVKKAESFEPTQNVYYLDTEGWIYYMSGDYEKALKLIEASIYQATERFQDGLSETFYHLGMTYLKLNKIENAIIAFKKAIKFNPYGEYGKLSEIELNKISK